MTVAELITYLQTFDQDTFVMRDDIDHGLEDMIISEFELTYIKWDVQGVRRPRLVRTKDTTKPKALIIE